MADSQITIGIRADASQLRADLALVNVQIAELGKQMRALAKEATVTGDTSALQAVAGQYQAASAHAARLGGELKTLSTAHKELVSPMAEAGHALGELRAHFGELGRSLGELAENIFPRFREIVALSIGAAAFEFVHLATEAAHGVREMENLSRAFGISTDSLEALHLVFAGTGTSIEDTNTTLSRMARAIGTAREEWIKTTGMMPGAVNVLRGELGHATEGVAAFRGGIKNLADDFVAGVKTMHGSDQHLPDFSKPLEVLHINLARFKDDAKGQIELMVAISKGLDHLGDSSVKAAVTAALVGRGFARSAEALHDLGPALQRVEHDIEHSGLGLQDYEKRQAKEFEISLATTRFYFERVKQIIGGGLGQALIPVFNEIKDLLTHNSAAIRTWATDTGKYLTDVAKDFIHLFTGAVHGADHVDLKTDFAKNFVLAKDAIVGAIGIIKEAFRGLMEVFDSVAKGINAVFGTKLSGKELAIVSAIGTVSGAFSTLALAAGTAASIVGLAVAAIGLPITVIIAALGIAALGVVKNWDLMKGTAQAFWDMLKALGSYISDTFVGLWAKATEAIAKAWTSVTDGITGNINALLGLLQSLAEAAGRVASAVGSALGADLAGAGANAEAAAMPFAPPGGGDFGGGGESAHAMGGLIRGLGTGTSDSIVARLSNGEFVVNARDTARHLGLLHAINNGFNAPRFALGGLIDGLANIMPAGPAFASGGLVTAGGGGSAGGGAVHVHFEGAYLPPEHPNVVKSLNRDARQAQMLSAGRKPGWVGG